MLPGNVDPRRPDKVQRYTPKTSNGNGQEDLTTDYMNILGQHPTTANAAEPIDKHAEASSVQIAEPNLQAHDDVLEVNNDELVVATNVIPTSPQYGVAIIPNTTTNDVQPDTEPTDVLIKPSEDGKELHSTPSRNDRFKVVKIASLEPFKRGRWKCMDYVDEVPANTTQSKVAQSSGSIQIQPGGTFLHSTQSLPQHQIQQMLLQTGFVTPFFSGVPAQMLNQGQYFYPQAANMPNQNLNQQVPSSMPAQYINSAQQYIPAGMAGFTMPPNYQNVQYVPTNLIQTQNSAFVPTSQTIQLPANFQQSQTYAGPNVSQTNVTQPLVNGHSYPPQQNDQQVTSCSLPTQTAKSVILNSQPAVSQSQLTQQTVNHIPGVQSTNQTPVPSLQNQYQQTAFQQQQATPALIQVSQVQNFDQSLANNVYTNPQFTMSVNSLTVLDPHEQADNANDANSGTDAANENADDLSKTNPVVNAIDNKIEQAMDLVKSHLMYTVREEVEVLKEKITELYDKIGQLETENSFLRSQVNNQGPVSANANAITNQNAQQSVANASPNTNATSSGSTGTNPNSTEPVQK